MLWSFRNLDVTLRSAVDKVLNPQLDKPLTQTPLAHELCSLRVTSLHARSVVSVLLCRSNVRGTIDLLQSVLSLNRNLTSVVVESGRHVVVWETVARIALNHARLANGAVAHQHTLDHVAGT